MLVKTILNRCHKFKSFVYGEVKFVSNKSSCTSIEVQLSPVKTVKQFALLVFVRHQSMTLPKSQESSSFVSAL